MYNDKMPYEQHTDGLAKEMWLGISYGWVNWDTLLIDRDLGGYEIINGRIVIDADVTSSS